MGCVKKKRYRGPVVARGRGGRNLMKDFDERYLNPLIEQMQAGTAFPEAQAFWEELGELLEDEPEED